MANPQGIQHPLQVLPTIVDRVLLQVARVFRDPSLHSPKSIIHTNEQTKRIISGAQHGFHDALDELEIEILRAMAVMESDLATLQSHRAMREQEASIGRAVTSAAPDKNLLQQSQQIDTDTVTADEPAGENVKAADGIVTDPFIKIEAPGPLDQESKMTLDVPPKAESPTPRENQKSDPPPEAKPAAPAKNLVTTSNDKAAENQSGMEAENENTTSIEVPVPDETPTSGDIKDLDFDSMFDDTVGGGGNDEMNFDMDFPTHAGNSEALLIDDPFAANAISGKVSALPTGPIEDIDSLLPGLESFANATDDFAMVNIGTTSASAESAVKTVPTSRPAAKSADAPPDLLPPESNFDDMFFGSVDFPMEDGNEGGNADDDFGELGDFDENWFKTDST